MCDSGESPDVSVCDTISSMKSPSVCQSHDSSVRQSIHNSTWKSACLSVLTEKKESSHKRHNRQHNDGKVTSLGSLLGVPVKLSIGIAVQSIQKQQSNLHTQKSLGYPKGLFGRSYMGNTM